MSQIADPPLTGSRPVRSAERRAPRALAGLFALLPIPVFIDCRDLSVIASDDIFAVQAAIPLPVGVLVFATYVLVSNLYALRDRTFVPLIERRDRIALAFLTALAGLYFLLVSQLSPPRVVQLLLPAGLMLGVLAPRDVEWWRTAGKCALAGAAAFALLHAVSLASYADSFLHPTNQEFVRLYSTGIYQGLVAYPGALIVYSILSIWFYLTSAGTTARRCYAAFFLGMTVYLSLAARKIALVDFFSTALALFGLLATYAVGGRASREIDLGRTAAALGLLLAALAVHVVLFRGESPLLERLASNATDRGVAQDRIEIWGEFFRTVDPGMLAFGRGGREPPKWHNYVLDTVHLVGLVGMLGVAALTAAVFYLAYRGAVAVSGSVGLVKLAFTFLLLAHLAAHSTFNSAVTQPLQMANWMFAFFSVGLSSRSRE